MSVSASPVSLSIGFSLWVAAGRGGGRGLQAVHPAAAAPLPPDRRRRPPARPAPARPLCLCLSLGVAGRQQGRAGAEAFGGGQRRRFGWRTAVSVHRRDARKGSMVLVKGWQPCVSFVPRWGSSGIAAEVLVSHGCPSSRECGGWLPRLGPVPPSRGGRRHPRVWHGQQRGLRAACPAATARRPPHRPPGRPPRPPPQGGRSASTGIGYWWPTTSTAVCTVAHR